MSRITGVLVAGDQVSCDRLRLLKRRDDGITGSTRTYSRARVPLTSVT